MRKLVYVPIIHDEIDLGSLAEPMARAYRVRHGEDKLEEHRDRVETLWRSIEEKLDSLSLEPDRVRIYQDSLPVCGKEREMVRDLAARGSRNHGIVLGLIERGALLEGTEDPALLLEEYERQLLGRPAKAILERRDRFIAKRVDETLRDGETGILFIGLLHDVASKLKEDIDVEFVGLDALTAAPRGEANRPGTRRDP